MKKVLLALLSIGLIILILALLSLNLSPYISVSELVKREKAYGVQVVGVIVKNSTVIAPNAIYFKLTDGKATITVECKSLPSNYREGVQVVVVGDYYNNTLYANQILFKCASKYIL
ncbi:MAG TPA: cytochrome c maturation protein CcmE [Archaeoglobus profundus]|nr:cytochrome c maturation protein CcmE [Archaeoglobus profundus]